jgi:hypothetical protein
MGVARLRADGRLDKYFLGQSDAPVMFEVNRLP